MHKLTNLYAMERIISIQANPFYLKDKKQNVSEPDKLAKYLELTIITESSKYDMNLKGEIIRLPKFREYPFAILAEHFDSLLENLKKLNQIDESVENTNAVVAEEL